MKILQILAKITLKPFDVSTSEGRSNERNRRIALSTLASVFAKILTVLTSLISVPLAVDYLGAERYGLWMTITSLLAIAACADLGIGNGLVNAVVESSSKCDKVAVRRDVSSSFYLLLGISIIFIIIFKNIYDFIPWGKIFNVTNSLAIDEAGPTIAVVFICFSLGLPLNVVHKVQIGFQEGLQSNLWLCAGSLLGLVSVILAIKLELGLPWLVFAMVGGPLVLTGLNFIIHFYWIRPWAQPVCKDFNLTTSKKIITIGSMFFILQIFSMIGNSSDSIVLSQIIGPAAVTEYSVVQKMFSLGFIIQFFIAPLWPAFGDALERKDYAWARITLKRALYLSLTLSIIIAVPIVIFGQRIIEVWMGMQFIPSYNILLAFGFMVFLTSYGGVMSVLLNNGIFLQKQVFFYGLASVVALLLKVVLVHEMGVSGVVWGTVIAYTLLYAIPAGVLAKSAMQYS